MADSYRDLPNRRSHKGDKLNIYAIHDIKAEAFLKPFFADADGLAIRMFQEAANDQDHGFCKYAEDYTLYRIGVWDEQNGVVHASTHKTLGNALQYKEQPLAREEPAKLGTPLETVPAQWPVKENPPQPNSKSV